eukprot:ANDGO_03486.mRNA.1 hypothetical protein (macronuclear)
MTSSGESVYSLIPRDAVNAPKQPLYRSKYPGDAPPTGSTLGLRGTSKSVANVSGDFVHPDAGPGSSHTIRKTGALFGTGSAKESVDPQSFTRKRQGDRSLPEPTRFVYADEYARKPAVPARMEKPVMGLHSEKNFVVENAVDAILSKPSAIAAGKRSSSNRKKFDDDGVDWTRKKDYGQPPEYLASVKADVEREYEMVRKMHADRARRMEEHKNGGMRLMTDDEKNALLDGLKNRWEEVMRHFQTISFTMHTASQKSAKDKDEQELKFLEKEIEKLARPQVWIVDN